MNGSFKMQFTDFNEALVQLKEAQKENIDYTTRLYQTMSNQLNTSYAKQSEAMKDLVNELGQVQGRYMSTATRITQDNQEIQKLQQQDYQRIADYLHESEKSSAKFWVACNQTMQKYVEAAAQGMEKVSAANQAGKDVLEANRKLVEQLDVKMKDFVSYQKMTYETMEEVRKLLQTFLFRKRITIFIFPAERRLRVRRRRIRRRNTQASGRTERTSGGTSGGNEQKYEKYFQKPER